MHTSDHVAPEGGRPLRILIAAETYPPNINGAAQFCYRLAKGMTARGHEVRVVTPRASAGGPLIERRPEAVVYSVPSHAAATFKEFRISMWWDAKAGVASLLDDFQPDVVHSQSQYFVCEMAVREARKRGIRVVTTNHTMPENLYPHFPFPEWLKRASGWILWRHAEFILSKSDVLTVPTPLAAQTHERLTRLRGILPISNGIETSDYAARPGDSEPAPGTREILFTGRLAGEKHLDLLIRAFEKLSHPGARLVIAGTGELEAALRQQAAESSAADRIEFLGYVSEEDLRRAYRRAALFVMPGTAELQSLATLEAMSASTPVVAADAMALPHLVDEGANGWLFQPGDVDDLAEKMARVLSLDDDALAAFGRRSLEMAEAHSLHATLDAFERLYRG
ncbi:glycosyltransferase [Falsarthrobacter nasiphocae]|uniref:D-inositol 3-phosphate glycosyltransferase n=1 Tax=Falsarthrobacter nasiphocae TaxID=189863 RepID=A0AAE3YHZ2_9MICC|nr:glycosyltransferase [Falsarthrobacter nasiphocae]MDR6892632.1 glycosyltransferase involved in cell wall biosynthesis [Falsarthrobacter nasiphocae]